MSLPDPNTITISGLGAVALPRTSVAEDRSEYTSSDGLVQLIASHDYGKRIRRMARLDLSKVTSDPFRPSENVKVGMSVYTVFDLPPAGYTQADALAAWIGFNAFLTASSNAVTTKILGGES
uniref:Uncharacterized protein n=1 Tax=Leviviridae sp. TaxID=2027243 RepID=A0A514D2P8_9VIRU|nr:MAG: hypothetical protein H2Rhizo33298e3776_000004 [Leviviridae sp.]